MLYVSGCWSLKSYILAKLFYDVHKKIQLFVATRYANLSLLKGKKFASDYSSKKKNVKFFLDTIHDSKLIVDPSKMELKFDSLQNNKKPLKIVYFGRVVQYKGIQDALYAISKIKKQSTIKIEFAIIGHGNYLGVLKNLVKDLELNSCVKFIAPIAFGRELFDEISKHDLLIALPQREDTPRSAFDAMAAGLPILAYDTYYYKDLLHSGAIITTKWRDIDLLSKTLMKITKEKSSLIEKSKKAIAFSKTNTQKIWMEKRIKWTKEALNN
jgi:glycosyltransferase involved in cell wall biosynthesis